MVTKSKPDTSHTWKLAEAKNNLSRVFTRAIDEGPQVITRRDDTAVLISRAEYDRLRDLEPAEPEKPNFVEFLLSWPNMEDMDISRDPSPARDVEW